MHGCDDQDHAELPLRPDPTGPQHRDAQLFVCRGGRAVGARLLSWLQVLFVIILCVEDGGGNTPETRFDSSAGEEGEGVRMRMRLCAVPGPARGPQAEEQDVQGPRGSRGPRTSWSGRQEPDDRVVRGQKSDSPWPQGP